MQFSNSKKIKKETFNLAPVRLKNRVCLQKK